MRVAGLDVTWHADDDGQDVISIIDPSTPTTPILAGTPEQMAWLADQILLRVGEVIEERTGALMLGMPLGDVLTDPGLRLPERARRCDGLLTRWSA